MTPWASARTSLLLLAQRRADSRSGPGKARSIQKLGVKRRRVDVEGMLSHLLIHSLSVINSNVSQSSQIPVHDLT